ncbi:shikimate kinase [Intestinimonas massiliensis (ex Afouda et al. 2020)]|uniref:shikimate kinase n=1 Tax=Intestinimonas massiliensis (ex Afouda et al. 2020) TaxID=1673721 RepID=UPI00102FBE73|nr:shikimate kinase [Intestinimonas massiliensis (ex Afouda et al. 2020)]
MRDNVVLIGMMGCGKTTVGGLLARKLGFTFVDTDQYIEEALGRSIPDVFAKEGEAFFRDWELGAAEELAQQRRLVISCGGGLPTRCDSIASLKYSGTVIFLRRDPGEIYDNVSMGGRPLGQQGREAFLERYAAREPIYLEWADHVVDVQPTPVETAQRILEVLNA